MQGDVERKQRSEEDGDSSARMHEGSCGNPVRGPSGEKVVMTAVEVLRTDQSWIQKTPGKCGGRACIRDTRIPVWSLVAAQRLGASDIALLDYFVTPLTPGDIQAAWAYHEQHPEEIETDIRQSACTSMEAPP